jgi:hypothetical protein
MADDQGHGQRKRGADVSEAYEKAYKRLSGGSGTGSSTSRTGNYYFFCLVVRKTRAHSWASKFANVSNITSLT